jgi:uncharacterized protein YjeT (DUF2065 family)
VLHNLIFAMGIGRILIGLAPFVAADLTSRAIGFPSTHDNPTARLMARFFGVRDVGLGVLVFYALRHPETLGFMVLFNAVMDFGDLFSVLIPLLRRQGIDRGALTSAAFALPAGVAWLVVASALGGSVVG